MSDKLTPKERAAISLLETLLYCDRDPVEYLCRIKEELTQHQYDAALDQVRKARARMAAPLLSYLAGRGHDVSGYHALALDQGAAA